MPTTVQMLANYPDVLLVVLAELRGALLDGAETREQRVELLAAQITDPTSVQMAYQEVVDVAPQAEAALNLLLREHGEMAEAQFSREYGAIRQMGPAKLERESPWLYPENVAELLYYYGLIGRAFKGAGQQAHTVIYVPSDVAPWLPHPQSEAAQGGLPVTPVAPPPAPRTLPADDSFLEDAGTLLGFLYTERLRLTAQGPHPEDVDRLVQRFQMPFNGDVPDLNVRLALLLHLANRLGWLRRDGDIVQLTQNAVRAFLDKTRAEQRRALFDAWRGSPEWNDLCRTPELECADTGNWTNDPLQTRETLLRLFGQLQPGAWYSQAAIIEAVRKVEPDFQRPTGDYDTWYVRSTTTQEFLKGFEQWDAVEGALLRFGMRGPLFWLAVVDLAEPAAGSDLLVSLSRWGATWLGHDVPAPEEHVSNVIQVAEDFTLTLEPGVSLADRFRVERFAQWKQSYPNFVYQITQRTLKRAAERGITGPRIARFLREHGRPAPMRVIAAVERFDTGERVQRS
ncbi:MAG: hypothetical protein H3C34_14335 [Caldilineaceae bacterium]|nr:hypothetical protein [Caldilineaceae bacterium]